MSSCYTLEEKLYAVSLVRDHRMTYRQASRICGISRTHICSMVHDLDERLGKARDPVRGALEQKGATMPDLKDLPDDPEELKRIIFDMQFEIDLKEAIVEILKKDPGAHLKGLKNKEKALLVSALAEKKTYSIGWMTSYLGLAPATFYYHSKRLGEDREKELRAKVVEVSAAHPEFGYRRVKRALAKGREGMAHVSEKRIRRIMAEEGIQPARRRKTSRYSAYDARLDAGAPLPNVPLREDGTHAFEASAPNVLWLSDVTEFRLPDDSRVYLSPVLDCYDSSLVGWSISTSAKADDLTNPSLEQAAGKLTEGDACTIHTDKGGQYFSDRWVGICSDFDIARSMSRKGHSPDNARMEGFFGRLKMEFFDTRSWKGVGTEAFIDELDGWLVYYNEEREKESLGWMSPVQYRKRYFNVA